MSTARKEIRIAPLRLDALNHPNHRTLLVIWTSQVGEGCSSLELVDVEYPATMNQFCCAVNDESLTDEASKFTRGSKTRPGVDNRFTTIC